MTNVVPIRPHNGRLEQTPAELGESLAQRMQDMHFADYLRELDEVLTIMRLKLQEGGRPLPVTFLICRDIRAEAISAWTNIWIVRRAQEAREARQRRKAARV